MALPTSFESPRQYFQAAIEAFHEFKQLYNFANTKVLSNNVIQNINIVNLENIDVFDQNFNLKDASRNEFIRDFMKKICRLTVVYEDFKYGIEDRNLNAPIGEKKRHEILYLAREIRELCEATNCETVIDFGSGLGYLDQHLNEITNFDILGIECNKQNCINAHKRQEKYYKKSTDKVKYIHHTLGKASLHFVEGSLKDNFESSNVCLTGLHACADLTINSFDLFLNMTTARCMMLLSCCYHKMALTSNKDKFEHFPLSKCLKEVFNERNCGEYLNIPFLRLAAQPPFWIEDLEALVFNLLARATLEVYAEKYDYKLTRRKRKAVNTKIVENNFESYMKKVEDGFTLSCKSSTESKCKCNLTFDKEELRYIWRQNQKETFKKAAIFVLIQRHLQPAFENLILFDRVTYLRENGVPNSFVKRVFDGKISPRCLAIVAIKDR